MESRSPRAVARRGLRRDGARALGRGSAEWRGVDPGGHRAPAAARTIRAARRQRSVAGPFRIGSPAAPPDWIASSASCGARRSAPAPLGERPTRARPPASRGRQPHVLQPRGAQRRDRRAAREAQHASVQKLEGCRRSAFESIDRPAMKSLPTPRYEVADWRRRSDRSASTSRRCSNAGLTAPCWLLHGSARNSRAPGCLMRPFDSRDGGHRAVGRPRCSPRQGALRGRGSAGGSLVDPLVRARGVVVADVLGDDALEVPAVEHENVVGMRR